MLLEMEKFLRRDIIGFARYMKNLKIKKNIGGKKIQAK